MEKDNVLQSLFIFFLMFSQFLHTKPKEVIRAQCILENLKHWKRFLGLKKIFKKNGLIFVDSSPDVILCNHVTEEVLEKNVPIILMERRSSGSLRESTRKVMLNKQVKAVFKNRVLKDKELHHVASYQNCYHFNLINDSAQLPLELLTPTSLSMRELDKIHCIICSLDNSPFSSRGMKLKRIKIDFTQERPIDVFFAGRTILIGDSSARKLYTWHREQAVKQLKKIRGINILSLDSNKALSFQDYIAITKKSKIVVSPWGTGAWAHRDYEAMHCGAVLLKPDTGFLKAIPDIYQNNVTYVPCCPDFSDLEERIREILENYDDYQHMRKYAKQILVDSWDMEKLAFDFVQAVKDALGLYGQIDKKLKILVVVNKFPTISTNLLLPIVGLNTFGHDVYVYATHGGRALSQTLIDALEEYSLLDFLYKRTYYNERYEEKIKLANLPPDLSSFDIILCQLGGLGKIFAEVKKSKKINSKLVTFFRGADLCKVYAKESNEYDELFCDGDLFLPVCHAFVEKLRALGANKDKIKVCFTGIDSDKFAYSKRFYASGGIICVVTVCRLIEKKGLKVAISAMANIIKEFSNVRYAIVGSGELRTDLKRLIKKLGVQNKIKLIGSRSQKGVINILSKAHIFIHPSVTAKDGDGEGIPRALKEAMSCGMPVIATLHNGIPEVVDEGISGFLVPEYDVVSLENRLRYLILNPHVWNKMGKAGRKKIKKMHDMKVVNRYLEKILQQLVMENFNQEKGEESYCGGRI